MSHTLYVIPHSGLTHKRAVVCQLNRKYYIVLLGKNLQAVVYLCGNILLRITKHSQQLPKNTENSSRTFSCDGGLLCVSGLGVCVCAFLVSFQACLTVIFFFLFVVCDKELVGKESWDGNHLLCSYLCCCFSHVRSCKHTATTLIQLRGYQIGNCLCLFWESAPLILSGNIYKHNPQSTWCA